MVDDWQYHQDSRDEATGLGCAILVFTGAAVLAIVILAVLSTNVVL